MTKLEMYEPLINDSLKFGREHNLTRLKIETLDFDFDFKLNHYNILELATIKAVIRVIGKTTKVTIGPDEEHQTYESAYEATKTYWQQYFKNYRDNYETTPAGVRGVRRKAKAYQQRRRDKAKAIKHRQ